MFRIFGCFLFGHRPSFNGQRYEEVTVHGLDGKRRSERRLVEREWCGRCGKLLSVNVPARSEEETAG